jgi:hypothetical protein
MLPKTMSVLRHLAKDCIVAATAAHALVIGQRRYVAGSGLRFVISLSSMSRPAGVLQKQVVAVQPARPAGVLQKQVVAVQHDVSACRSPAEAGGSGAAGSACRSPAEAGGSGAASPIATTFQDGIFCPPSW